MVRNLTALEKASERKTIELVAMQKEKEKIRRPRKKWLLLSPAAKVCAITQVREEIEMVKVERTECIERGEITQGVNRLEQIQIIIIITANGGNELSALGALFE